jgi:hypothetical protein
MRLTVGSLALLLRSRAITAALVCSIALHWTGASTSAQQMYIDPTKGALQVDRSRDPYAPGYAKEVKRSGTIGPGLYPPGTRSPQARPKPRKARDCTQLRKGASRRERARHYRQCRDRS